jgi:hypothetical protein
MFKLLVLYFSLKFAVGLELGFFVHFHVIWKFTTIPANMSLFFASERYYSLFSWQNCSDTALYGQQVVSVRRYQPDSGFIIHFGGQVLRLKIKLRFCVRSIGIFLIFY